MPRGRNVCDGRVAVSVRTVHAKSRGLTRPRTLSALSVVSLSTWAPGRVVSIVFQLNRSVKRKAGRKPMSLRGKARRNANIAHMVWEQAV